MWTERDLTLGDGCTMQHVDDVLLSYTLETYMVLLINVTLILNKKKQIALLGIKSNPSLSVQLYFCPVHHILLQKLNFSLLPDC